MLFFRKNETKELEKRIGYTFKKRTFLETALIHRSYRFENDGISEDNQRLEFLGDAVLGMISGTYLFRSFKESDEGLLTNMRSQVTSGKALAEIARCIGLGEFIRMGKGEENSGGRKRSSTLADGIEAVIGAVYLDGGLKGVQKVFNRLFVPVIEGLTGDVWADNPKGKLQEYAQRKHKQSPKYSIVKKDGPAHSSIFTVEVEINGVVRGKGKGKNKQEAEKKAASHALRALNLV